MLKRRIEKMEIVPCTQYQGGEKLYSLYINGQLDAHASAEYMGRIVEEILLNSQNEEDNENESEI